MVREFAFWLEAIVEECPLPEEINIIVFNLAQAGDFRYVELLGFEGKVDFNQIGYKTLESHIFKNKDLNKMQINKFIIRIKYLIEEAFASEFLKQQYFARKIYLLAENNLEYLFSVKK